MTAKRLAVAVVVLPLAWTAWAQAGMPTVTHDGRAYVELTRVAASLQKTKLDASAVSTRARLRTGDRVVTLTRNWAQMLVDGKPVLLDAPVRVKRGVWLVPESFAKRVVRALRRGADGLLRVVFEGAAGTIRATMLVDPPRLVLDVARPVEPARSGRERLTPLRTIVLDAGHGGHDSGAMGPTGLMEKDLVLDVTRRVGKLVEERLGIKVRFTRDADHFVTLRDRTSFANRERADLFVSIHANAHRETATDGVETYFLSSEATDSAARQVAAAENGVVQLESAGGRGNGGKTDIVRMILWDLAQSEFQMESSRLAEVVHDSMTQSLRISNRGVKQAGFYVLGGAAMPAILIEIGFVTNPREEKRLKDTRYRDEIARAILTGLTEYKRNWDERTRTP